MKNSAQYQAQIQCENNQQAYKANYKIAGMNVVEEKETDQQQTP